MERRGAEGRLAHAVRLPHLRFHVPAPPRRDLRAPRRALRGAARRRRRRLPPARHGVRRSRAGRLRPRRGLGLQPPTRSETEAALMPTPILGLPYPTDDDLAQVPRDIKALADAIDPLGVLPVGALCMWPTAAAPTGW